MPAIVAAWLVVALSPLAAMRHWVRASLPSGLLVLATVDALLMILVAQCSGHWRPAGNHQLSLAATVAAWMLLAVYALRVRAMFRIPARRCRGDRDTSRRGTGATVGPLCR